MENNKNGNGHGQAKKKRSRKNTRDNWELALMQLVRKGINADVPSPFMVRAMTTATHALIMTHTTHEVIRLMARKKN